MVFYGVGCSEGKADIQWKDCVKLAETAEAQMEALKNSKQRWAHHPRV
jgi:hypothetical protein